MVAIVEAVRNMQNQILIMRVYSMVIIHSVDS